MCFTILLPGAYIRQQTEYKQYSRLVCTLSLPHCIPQGSFVVLVCINSLRDSFQHNKSSPFIEMSTSSTSSPSEIGASAASTYKVYKIFEVTFNPDPRRQHHAIFIATNSDGSGNVFQVTGNVQQGMRYETKPWSLPEAYLSFSHKEALGAVSKEEYHRIGAVCERIPPPEKQYEGRKKLQPDKPLRNCQDWTTDVIDALIGEGVLRQD